MRSLHLSKLPEIFESFCCRKKCSTCKGLRKNPYILTWVDQIKQLLDVQPPVAGHELPIISSMKKNILYFLWKLQIFLFIVFIGCSWNQERANFNLGALKAQDLVKLDENIEPKSEFPWEGAINIPFMVKSPDGKRVAKVVRIGTGIESQVYLVSVLAVNEKSEIKIAEAVNFFGLCWSPDGSKIAYSEGTMVHIADSDGLTKQIIYIGPGGPYPGASFNLRWSNNGQQLSFMQVVNAQTSELANPSFVTITLGMK